MRRSLPYHMPSKGEPFLGFLLVFFFFHNRLQYAFLLSSSGDFIFLVLPFLRSWLQRNVNIYLNIFLLFVGIWIFARTLIQEGIIQSPKAGSFITTVLIIIGAGLMIFSLFHFFSDSW